MPTPFFLRASGAQAEADAHMLLLVWHHYIGLQTTAKSASVDISHQRSFGRWVPLVPTRVPGTPFPIAG